MIISHSKRFIFFRPTKTGSTTADVLLRLSGAFDPAQDVFCQTKEWELRPRNVPATSTEITDIGMAHATPRRLIDLGVMTLEQLREYDCYAFLRPVESRFVSGYLHCMRTGKWGTVGRYGYQPKQFMERWRSRQRCFNPSDLLGHAQVDWFFLDGEQLVKPLDFKDYEAGLRRLLDVVGGFQFPEIPRINRAHQHHVVNENRREWARSIWNDYAEIQREILEWYSDDHNFYVTNFGETNEIPANRDRTDPGWMLDAGGVPLRPCLQADA